MPTTPEQQPQYRIGAVSRLTGIPPVTIRMWERRYAVTEPARTPAGDRLYNDNDVKRLGLLKIAVDSGHSISNAAKLSADQLSEVVSSTPTRHKEENEPLYIAVLGDFLPASIGETDVLPYNVKVTFTGTVNSAAPATKDSKLAVDLVIVELQVLDDNSYKTATECRNRFGARHALVVYQYAAKNAIEKLDSISTQAVRAPLPTAQLASICQSIARAPAKLLVMPESLEKILKAPVPKQRYSGQQLAKLSQLESVKCECPTHMADLVRSLQAFEQYSEQCESSNKQDAEMHKMLHLVTAQARRNMEEALHTLVEFEYPELNP